MDGEEGTPNEGKVSRNSQLKKKPREWVDTGHGARGSDKREGSLWGGGGGPWARVKVRRRRCAVRKRRLAAAPCGGGLTWEHLAHTHGDLFWQTESRTWLKAGRHAMCPPPRRR